MDLFQAYMINSNIVHMSVITLHIKYNNLILLTDTQLKAFGHNPINNYQFCKVIIKSKLTIFNFFMQYCSVLHIITYFFFKSVSQSLIKIISAPICSNISYLL